MPLWSRLGVGCSLAVARAPMGGFLRDPKLSRAVREAFASILRGRRWTAETMRRRECSGSGIAAIISRRSCLAAANAGQPSEPLEVLERSGGLLRRLLMLHHPSSIKLSGGADVVGRAIPRPSDTPSITLFGTPAGRRGRGAARIALKGRRRSAGQWSGSGTIQLARTERAN